jgi:transposase-like protein
MKDKWPVAQSVERSAVNADVAGSSPARSAKPSLIDQVKAMVADGLGYEDISVRMKIPRSTAYWYVFKRLRRRQQ